jgi:hypothetical protein
MPCVSRPTVGYWARTAAARRPPADLPSALTSRGSPSPDQLGRPARRIRASRGDEHGCMAGVTAPRTAQHWPSQAKLGQQPATEHRAALSAVAPRDPPPPRRGREGGAGLKSVSMHVVILALPITFCGQHASHREHRRHGPKANRMTRRMTPMALTDGEAA